MRVGTQAVLHPRPSSHPASRSTAAPQTCLTLCNSHHRCDVCFAGSVVGSHAVPYATAFPKPGWAEQNPADWWSALGEAAQGAVRAAGVPASDIAALCADTTCCTVCALDESESTRHALPQSLQILWPRPDVLAPWQAGPCACPRLLPDGDAVRPALLWCDMRSAPQAARIAATGDPALRVNSAGKGPVSAEWMLCKSLWLKEKEPDTWSRAARVCEYQDYINYKLTGRYVASLNNVSVRWHYDVNRGALYRRRVCVHTHTHTHTHTHAVFSFMELHALAPCISTYISSLCVCVCVCVRVCVCVCVCAHMQVGPCHC